MTPTPELLRMRFPQIGDLQIEETLRFLTLILFCPSSNTNARSKFLCRSSSTGRELAQLKLNGAQTNQLPVMKTTSSIARMQTPRETRGVNAIFASCPRESREWR